jgi:hypothetical protein
MRHGRFITTALVATAAMAIGPAWASAAPSPLVDDAQSDFAAGAPTGTWAVEPGSVRLKLGAAAENFDAGIPAGYSGTAWPMGQGGAQTGGNASVTGGALTVDGAHFNDTSPAPTFSAPQTMEFRATLGSDEYQNIGLGDTFNDGPWAMFSTGPTTATPGTFFARTMAVAGGTPVDTAIAGVDLTQPHVFRIEWGATDVKFYVDGTLVATNPSAITALMRPVVSDLNIAAPTGGPAVKVDWLDMGVPASGTFVSRVLSADSAHTVWGNLTGASSGTTFETRSGNTATADASWSGFQAVGASGAIQSPSGQYIQYRATLTGAAASVDSASLAYTVDNTAPSAAIGSVDVSGTSASVSFSSPDGDIAGFQCSLDGGAFAACASPRAFTGLAAGAHTVVVRPVDKAGNVGPTVSRTFSIASAQSGGGGGQTGGGGSSAVDKTAPKVTLVAKSLKASRKGAVSFTVRCPATEATCQITLKLKNGARTVASKTVTVKGGKTKTVTLQLNKATRQQLKHRSLKLSSVLSATDAAGNTKTTSRTVTLHKS